MGMNAPSIQSLLKTPVFSGLALSPDGERLLTSSDVSGVFNALEIPLSGAPTRSLTQSKDNAVYILDYLPDAQGFLFVQDSGGDEVAHLYLCDKDGSIRDLTPWPGARIEPRGWVNNRKEYSFASNKEDKGRLDLWSLDTKTLETRLVYANKEGYLLGPLSRDGSQLALEEPLGLKDQNIYVHTLKSQETKLLTPHEGEVNQSPLAFSEDGSSLLFHSSVQGEFLDLWEVDLDSGKHSLVYENQGDITQLRLSRTGQYRAFTCDREGALELVLQRHQKEIPLHGLPKGQILHFRFSLDETQACFLCETPRQAPTPYLLDLATGEVTGPVVPPQGEIAPENLIEARHVFFESYDGLKVPGILYPASRTGEEPGPGLIFVHGGPGGQSRMSYRPMQQFLALCGYEVFCINNRGSSGYGKTFYGLDKRRHGDVDLDDCVAARQLLLDAGRVDPNRIGIIGGSYGGFMVLAALAFRSGTFRAGVDIFGVSNWVRTLQEFPPWWAAFMEAMWADMGHPVEDKEYLESISPLFHAHKIKTPLMVIQGENDPRVVKAESDEIVAAVRQNDVPVEYLVFPDEGHGFVKKENQATAYLGIKQFLDIHLA